MLRFYPVSVGFEIHRTNPLFVGNYFTLKGMWWKKRRLRQSLILSVALGWYELSKNSLNNPAFIQEELFLTSLKKHVGDARVILESFFHIDRIGFNFANGVSGATQVRPKKLNKDTVAAIESILNHIQYDPGPEPSCGKLTCSRVSVQPFDERAVTHRLLQEGRDSLVPAVRWLRENPSLNFYYQPSGKLRARDTSVWPVRSIETWPGWLRQELFGRVIDIENAYAQFMVNNLMQKYGSNRELLMLKYPDIMRSHYDKSNFREEICTTLLKLPATDDNISVVKKLIMSIANGSNVTSTLLISGSSRSEAVRIILEANPCLSTEDLLLVGKRLSFVARQFRMAKRDLCSHLLGLPPSANNSKKIFTRYFDWEREARYKIWNAVGKTGLMLHDGVDGIISQLSNDDLKNQLETTQLLRVSVESPAEFVA